MNVIFRIHCMNRYCIFEYFSQYMMLMGWLLWTVTRHKMLAGWPSQVQVDVYKNAGCCCWPFYDRHRDAGHPSKIHFSCSKDNLNVAHSFVLCSREKSLGIRGEPFCLEIFQRWPNAKFFWNIWLFVYRIILKVDGILAKTDTKKPTKKEDLWLVQILLKWAENIAKNYQIPRQKFTKINLKSP